jgi:transcriptional regulator of arginine metabolism
MAVPLEKRRRQSSLLRLVRHERLTNQAEIVRRLAQQGFSTTQAGVSRDLRELGLVKASGRYVPVSQVAADGRLAAGEEPLHELIIGAQPIGANLIVVRTRVGAAGAVAVALDRRAGPEIAGTIAGDDTIFVAVRSRSAQGRALALLRALGAGGHAATLTRRAGRKPQRE